MKRTLCLLIAVGCFGMLSAQPKYFEGTMTYHVRVKSKSSYLNDDEVARIFMTKGTKTGSMKNGNEHWSLGNADAYFIYKDKRVYFKFRTIDTLYYVDYASDTSKVLSVEKTDTAVKIGAYICKKLVVKTYGYTQTFYYTDAIRSDTNYYRDLQAGHYNTYERASAGGLSLWMQDEKNYGIMTDSCVEVVQQSVDDHVFDLPNLPQRSMVGARLYIPPRFPGKDGAFKEYLEKNANGVVAAKYVKIPKGQHEAVDSVEVLFYVNEDGSLSGIEALNKKEMPSALVNEAIRIVEESPRWIPATIYGEKIKEPIRQNVAFMNMK
jgi:hypothetical protein